MGASLTIIIPAYNDEATIESVVQEAAKTAATLHIPYTILVADDASSDRTAKTLKKLRIALPHLRIISHAHNLGYGSTIRKLYEKAQGSWIFSLPGDYQIDPKELARIWRHRNTADMIIGWRNSRHDSPERIFQSRIYNALIRRLYGLDTHDVNSVRLMKTSIIQSIQLTSSSAFVDAQLVIEAKHAGFRVIEIPISHRARRVTGAGGGKLTTILPTIMDMIKFWL